jgi:hypothetical protein
MPKQIGTHYNSVGLINCLPQPGQITDSSNSIWEKNFSHLYALLHRDKLLLPRQSLLGCGPTLRCLVFCSSPRQITVTRNFAAIYRDLIPSSSLTVTRGFSAIYRVWQKTMHRDADGNSLNRRAVIANNASTTDN